ncbi:MAG: carbohydrate ABC transporter permease, partial [Enterococcus sp.]
MTKEMQSNRRAKIAIGVALAIGAIIWMIPFVWMILSSFKTDAEIMQFPPKILPEHFSMDNFKELFEAFNFIVYLKNTLIVVAFS